jgi:hypothetical protein
MRRVLPSITQCLRRVLQRGLSDPVSVKLRPPSQERSFGGLVGGRARPTSHLMTRILIPALVVCYRSASWCRVRRRPPVTEGWILAGDRTGRGNRRKADGPSVKAGHDNKSRDGRRYGPTIWPFGKPSAGPPRPAPCGGATTRMPNAGQARCSAMPTGPGVVRVSRRGVSHPILECRANRSPWPRRLQLQRGLRSYLKP